MQSQILTKIENEYLAILYEFLENGLHRVRTSELKSKLYVTSGAVSSILKKLDKKLIEGESIINYLKGYGVSLTQLGKELAGKIIRRRRIGEIFLKHLGFNFNSIQKQIFLFTITDEISDKMEEEFFKDDHLKRCSHGLLVPNKDGNYKFENLKSLNQFDAESNVNIVKIPESPFYYIPQFSPKETNILLDIYNNNLIPNQPIKILAKDPKFMIIETNSYDTDIPMDLAKQIFVEEIQ